MSSALYWQQQQHCLQLSGELTASALLPLWSAKEQLLQGIRLINLSALRRTDSAGLALLLHLVLWGKRTSGKHLVLQGSSDNLYRLVQLYNLPASLFYQN